MFVTAVGLLTENTCRDDRFAGREVEGIWIATACLWSRVAARDRVVGGKACRLVAAEDWTKAMKHKISWDIAAGQKRR